MWSSGENIDISILMIILADLSLLGLDARFHIQQSIKQWSCCGITQHTWFGVTDEVSKMRVLVSSSSAVMPSAHTSCAGRGARLSTTLSFAATSSGAAYRSVNIISQGSSAKPILCFVLENPRKKRYVHQPNFLVFGDQPEIRNALNTRIHY